MASSDGLGALSILNEDLLRLILLDETLKDSFHCLASCSKQLLRQMLESGRAKKLTLRLKLAAKWGEWLQANGLHLQLNTGDISVDEAASLALLLPEPNRGISGLTVNLDVSDACMKADGIA